MTKKSVVASVATLCFFITIIVALAYFGFELLKKPVSADSTEIIFDVAPGASFAQITSDLQNKHLIRNSKVFHWYARLTGQATHVKTGEYSLNQTMSPDEIVSVLVSGKSIPHNITIAEGLNIFDIAGLFEKQKICSQEEFFKIVRDQEFIKAELGENLPSLEGYLFPETYKYTKFDGAKAIVTQMVKRFLTVWNDQLGPETKKLNWPRNQIITLASIVEKETGASTERPLVSSVFHNRIAKKMRLQTDPTVLYGMALAANKMPTNITKADLQNPTAYNTYTIDGLPPAPIANPGKEALIATLNPAISKYLYFVSQNNGTHAFSESLDQHNKAVQQFQMNAKARENKSWRDLKKPKK